MYVKNSEIKIVTADDIDIITDMRVKQQIENWSSTYPDKDYNIYTDDFFKITKKHIEPKLNKTMFFALMYLDKEPVATCGFEIMDSLPQITICENTNAKFAELIGVYTYPNHRCNGYQQKLISFLIEYAVTLGITDMILSSNSQYAKHVYEKVGFEYLADKYYLKCGKEN